jgi:transcriptional regulator with XRE-family HTH domain
VPVKNLGEQMSSFSERLMEERNKLGLNQTDFAALGGVKKNAQMKYESGERYPDAHYLQGLVVAGVDVNYLFTGFRTFQVAEDGGFYQLRPDQKALLDNYEHCSKEGKRIVAHTAISAASGDDEQGETRKTNEEQKRIG